MLESNKPCSTYQENDDMLFHVVCKADATEKLDQLIPYGLAVTFEVAKNQNIPIYESVRARISPKIAVHAGVDRS